MAVFEQPAKVEHTQKDETVSQKQACLNVDLEIERSEGGEHAFQRQKVFLEAAAVHEHLSLIDHQPIDVLQRPIHGVLQIIVRILQTAMKRRELKDAETWRQNDGRI